MDTKKFKKLLEEKKVALEKELSAIAHVDPDNPDDWKTNRDDLNIMPSDITELADVFEESQTKEALEKELEDRLNEVKAALERIENKKYGICQEGCKIEENRLNANPTATTCIKHA
ncbi:hypothetical protein ACFLZC_01290 [Patescibacteria group bacterium]